MAMAVVAVEILHISREVRVVVLSLVVVDLAVTLAINKLAQLMVVVAVREEILQIRV